MASFLTIDKLIGMRRIAFSERDITHYIGDTALSEGDYQLKIELSVDKDWKRGIYRDTRISLALYKGVPEIADAVCGISVERNRAIRISQLQGREHLSRFERLPYAWELGLVEATAEWAAELGFRTLQIQRAKDNKYFGTSRACNLGLRYDITAKEAGMQMDEKLKVWAMSLKN